MEEVEGGWKRKVGYKLTKGDYWNIAFFLPVFFIKLFIVYISYIYLYVLKGKHSKGSVLVLALLHTA